MFATSSATPTLEAEIIFVVREMEGRDKRDAMVGGERGERGERVVEMEAEAASRSCSVACLSKLNPLRGSVVSKLVMLGVILAGGGTAGAGDGAERVLARSRPGGERVERGSGTEPDSTCSCSRRCLEIAVGRDRNGRQAV